MTHGSLFSGIGGFDLAAQWMGWQNIFHCEWNEFGRKVLHHYWPNAESFNDITKTDFTKYANRIDILTGGFPCQPYSLAGKRKGKEDERHLWPEMLRAIREIQPRWVVGENVFGLINWNGGLVFDEVQTNLEAAGYEVWPYVLPACAKNAPHRRDRVWFVAYSNSRGGERYWNKYGKFGKFRQGWKNNEAICNNGKERDDASNTNSNGQHGSNGQHEKQSSEGGEYAQRNIEQVGGDAANADSGRQPRQEHGQEKSGWITKKGISINWQNFPTQSPICSGDDGLPAQLDGITFPKWRNESIKAYGNAIVPQVALQIFKAIQKCESL